MAVQIGLGLLPETVTSLRSRKEKRDGVFSPELWLRQADAEGGQGGEDTKSGWCFSS